MSITHRFKKLPVIRFRSPTLQDASAIRTLISQCPPLDVNSCYAYLLQSVHLNDTCIVAEAGRHLAGYVSAYRIPNKPNTLFVWQVAVDAQFRGQRLGSQMINEILARPACRKIERLETTVSPGNDASERLFLNLAREHQASCNVEQLFGNNMFDDPGHAPEHLYRIEPLNRESILRAVADTVIERAV